MFTKRIAALIVALLCLVIGQIACAQSNAETETLRAATNDAINKIAADLNRSNFKIQNVAVLPLLDDRDGYFTSSLKSAVTRTHYALFTRDETECNTLLAEIEWGVRRVDIMDPATVQKFGRISGVNAILYGQVWEQNLNMWNIRGRSRVTLTLAEVETGRILWSSGPVEGSAYMHWSDALTQFWRFPLVIVAMVLALIVLGVITRKIRRAFRPL